MTAKEKCYYELGKLVMAQKIVKAMKDSSLLYTTNDSSRLMGIADTWDIVYEIIDKETEGL